MDRKVQEANNKSSGRTSGKKEDVLSKIIRIFNSTLAFCIAYIVLAYGYMFASAFAASYVGFDVSFSFYDIDLPEEFKYWNRRTASYVYSAGAIFCFVIGLGAGFLRTQVLDTKRGAWTLLLLWIQVLGMLQIVIELLMIPFGYEDYDSELYTGMAVVVSWYQGRALYAILSWIPSILGITMCALVFPSSFISFSFSRSLVRSDKGKRRFFLEMAIVPFILGSIIITFVTSPNYILLHVFQLVVLAIFFLFSHVLAGFQSSPKVFRSNSVQKFSPILLFLMITIAAVVWFTGDYVFRY